MQGYYDADHFERAAADVAQYVKDGRTSGVYFTFNPPDPALLARASNRIEKFSTTTTSDHDIVYRAWLLVDCDSKRPTGISSTSDELNASKLRAAEITEWMMQQGMCEPIVAVSGNGAHLLFPIRLPNDAESTALVKRVLEVLDQEFTDAAVNVDLTVHNAARICLLYGTYARKGDNTDDRPHRMGRLVHVPDYIERRTAEYTDVETLRRIADQYIQIPAKSSAGNGVTLAGNSKVMVDRYLADHGISYTQTDGAKGFTKYMIECPFSREHVRSYVFQHDSGAIGYKCSHNSCSDNKWEQFKAVYPVNRQRHYDPPLPDRDNRPVKLNAIIPQQDSKQDDHQPEPQTKLVVHSVWDAITNPEPMREVIIEGLVRRGEVMNVVAATKVGKSWLVALLAFCVAIGRRWFGRECTQGNVLLIDNELHPETIQNRMAAVARALGVQNSETRAGFDYVATRGESLGIGDIQSALADYKPGDLTLVILDAKYRFFNGEENSNEAQTQFHNAVDRLARQLDCVIVLVHHSTKGDQTGKSVADVGSGGGSQSRASDVHLIIRPHQEDNLAVMDAVVRTFAPVESVSIEWKFPLWTLAQSVEPILKAARTQGDSRQEAKDMKALGQLTAIIHENKGVPMTRYELHKAFGGGFDRVNRLIRLGLSEGRIVKAGRRETKKGPVDLYTLGSYVDP